MRNFKVLLTFVLLINLSFMSCGSPPTSDKEVVAVNTVEDTPEVSKRQVDIQQVLDHIKKSKMSNLTDGEGFPLNYEFTMEIIETKPLGKTKVISSIPSEGKDKNGYMNSMYGEISVSKVQVNLLLNGETRKKVNFVTQFYEVNQTNRFLDYYNKSKYTTNTVSYTPDLDDDATLKKAIKTFTTPNYYRDYIGRDKEEDSKYENEYINETTNLIKKSNIRDIRTWEEF